MKVCKRYLAKCHFSDQPTFTFVGALAFDKQEGEEALRKKIFETFPYQVVIEKYIEEEFELPKD